MAGKIAYLGNIVTQDLVLDLDAGIKGSYPGSGTTWTDISNSGNTCTLTNGPTFTDFNYGAIVFDGTNDFGTIPSFNLDSNPELSVFSWVYPMNTSQLKWLINKRDNVNDIQWQIIIGTTNIVSCNIYAGTTTSIGSASSSIAPNTWYHVGFTTGGVSGSDLSFYVNGTLAQSTTLTGNRKTGTRDLVIGKAAWTSNYYWSGSIATSTIHNRALSQTEVTQNFNAYRSRYGI